MRYVLLFAVLCLAGCSTPLDHHVDLPLLNARRIAAIGTALAARDAKIELLLEAAAEHKQIVAGNSEIVRANALLLRTNEAMLTIVKTKLDAMPVN